MATRVVRIDAGQDVGEEILKILIRGAQRNARRIFHISQQTEQCYVPVLTGYLKSSGSVTDDAEGATIRYDAPYASIVEYGHNGRDFRGEQKVKIKSHIREAFVRQPYNVQSHAVRRILRHMHLATRINIVESQKRDVKGKFMPGKEQLVEPGTKMWGDYVVGSFQRRAHRKRGKSITKQVRDNKGRFTSKMETTVGIPVKRTRVKSHTRIYKNKRLIKFAPKISKFERGPERWAVLSRIPPQEGQFYLTRATEEGLQFLAEDIQSEAGQVGVPQIGLA